MKRFLSIVVLCCMTLHCASRLGLVSYLYQNRHEIAFQLRLISEVPIALCSADYFGKKNSPLVVVDSQSDESQIPTQIAIAREIHLFSQDQQTLVFGSLSKRLVTHNTPCVVADYNSPPVNIFHPPLG